MLLFLLRRHKITVIYLRICMRLCIWNVQMQGLCSCSYFYIVQFTGGSVARLVVGDISIACYHDSIVTTHLPSGQLNKETTS